jgi:hypothetical protein
MDAMINITREMKPDGSVVISDQHCKFTFRRLRTGVLEVKIVGADNGQFGTATIDEIALALMRERSLELFIDASEASMPKVSVSKAWTQFFSLNRDNLKRVRILTASKSVAITMAIVRHLSDIGGLMQIYSDQELYHARKHASR